jgi:hypothetical protein
MHALPSSILLFGRRGGALVLRRGPLFKHVGWNVHLRRWVPVLGRATLLCSARDEWPKAVRRQRYRLRQMSDANMHKVTILFVVALAACSSSSSSPTGPADSFTSDSAETAADGADTRVCAGEGESCSDAVPCCSGACVGFGTNNHCPGGADAPACLPSGASCDANPAGCCSGICFDGGDGGQICN